MADKINNKEQMELEDKDLEKLSGGVVKVVRRGTDGSQQQLKEKCERLNVEKIVPSTFDGNETGTGGGIVKVSGSEFFGNDETHGPTKR